MRWAQIEIPLKCKIKLFHGDCRQTLAQAAHRDYRVFILEDIQNTTRQGPGKPALADPALSRDLD